MLLSSSSSLLPSSPSAVSTAFEREGTLARHSSIRSRVDSLGLVGDSLTKHSSTKS
jgi:hypothetical protein